MKKTLEAHIYVLGCPYMFVFVIYVSKGWGGKNLYNNRRFRIYIYIYVCARASLFKCSLFPFPNFVFQVISYVAPAADHRLK